MRLAMFINIHEIIDTNWRDTRRSRDLTADSLSSVSVEVAVACVVVSWLHLQLGNRSFLSAQFRCGLASPSLSQIVSWLPVLPVGHVPVIIHLCLNWGLCTFGCFINSHALRIRYKDAVRKVALSTSLWANGWYLVTWRPDRQGEDVKLQLGILFLKIDYLRIKKYRTN